MGVVEAVIEKLHQLPADQQAKVLDYVESLHKEMAQKDVPMRPTETREEGQFNPSDWGSLTGDID